MLQKLPFLRHRSLLSACLKVYKRPIIVYRACYITDNKFSAAVNGKSGYLLAGNFPTHDHVHGREIYTEVNKRSEWDEDDKVKRVDQHGVNFTFQYCFKFTYYYFHDRGIIYHVGRSFLEGTKAAFKYISECIAEDNYDALTEVVTPELLDRIRRDEGIRSPKSIKPDVFLVKDLKFVSFVDMGWSFDKATKIKTLEVLVRFAFFREPVGVPSKLAEYKEALTSGTMKGVPMNFAHLRFMRTYGEVMKDSPWIVKNLYYFTAAEKFVTPNK